MTRVEAIDLLDNLIGCIEDNHGSDYDKALKMAIEALKQPELIKCKDCAEWQQGKGYGMSCWSDEGFCCNWRVITNEDFYCVDARKKVNK